MTGGIINGRLASTVTLGVAPYASPLTITNSGAVITSGDGVTGIGTLLNGGSIVSTGSDGVYLGTGGSVSNTGLISGAGYGVYAEGGALNLNNSGTILGGAGYAGLALSLGSITNNSTGYIAGGAYGAVLFSSITLSNSGAIKAGSSGQGVQLDNGGKLINAGTIAGGASAVDSTNGTLALVVDPGALFQGKVAAKAGVANSIELAAGTGPGTLAMGSSFSGFATISFDTGADWSLQGNTLELGGTVTINGFTIGDTIDLTGLVANGATFAGNLLTLTNGSTVLAKLKVNEAAGLASNSIKAIADGSGGTDIVMCFYPGTRLATPSGSMQVQDLRAGDDVQTLDGPQIIRWIGQSQISTRFADPLRVLPICIRAGALGGGLPQRDLLLSPDHALFLDGILVQAAALVNGQNIVRLHNTPEHFTYYHVELNHHALLLAEGVPAESFVDNADRMHFHNWDARTAPTTPIPELPYPRAKAARQLPRTLRARLAAWQAA